ncbi:MAG: NAD(P)H-dependent oxidoreductase, partial [Longimicrobiales bacterium]
MIEPRVAIFPESTSARVVAFAGSLRRGSFNGALLRAAQELAPNRMEIDIIEIG